jgi:hypothetical protein
MSVTRRGIVVLLVMLLISWAIGSGAWARPGGPHQITAKHAGRTLGAARALPARAPTLARPPAAMTATVAEAAGDHESPTLDSPFVPPRS